MHDLARPAPAAECPATASFACKAPTQWGSECPATASPPPVRKKSRRRCGAPANGNSMGHAGRCNWSRRHSYLNRIIRDITVCRKDAEVQDFADSDRLSLLNSRWKDEIGSDSPRFLPS